MDINNCNIESIMNSIRYILQPLDEKMKICENREAIIKDLLFSLPEYKNLVNSNITLNNKLKNLSFNNNDCIQIAITDKNNNINVNCSVNNLLMDRKLLLAVSLWKNKFYDFVKGVSADSQYNNTVNVLKNDFERSVACYLNNVVLDDCYSDTDFETNELSEFKTNQFSETEENNSQSCSDTEEIICCRQDSSKETQ